MRSVVRNCVFLGLSVGFVASFSVQNVLSEEEAQEVADPELNNTFYFAETPDENGAATGELPTEFPEPTTGPCGAPNGSITTSSERLVQPWAHDSSEGVEIKRRFASFMLRARSLNSVFAPKQLNRAAAPLETHSPLAIATRRNHSQPTAPL